MKQITKGELMDAAADQGIDPEQSYDELREQVEFHTCKHCGDEYLHDTWDGYCSDGCQAEYINKYH